MEKEYNAYFLQMEEKMAEKRKELRKELEKRVKTQIEEQIEGVFEYMESQLTARWDLGGLGEEVAGKLAITIPEGPMARTYQEALNEVVRMQLQAYGFDVYFNCVKEEHPEVAEVHFNFTKSFYFPEKNWCSFVAQDYLFKKVVQTVSTLWQFVDLKLLSMRTGSVWEDVVKTTVALPPALRQIIADKVCETMKLLVGEYFEMSDCFLEGRDLICFKLKISLK